MILDYLGWNKLLKNFLSANVLYVTFVAFKGAIKYKLFFLSFPSRARAGSLLRERRNTVTQQRYLTLVPRTWTRSRLLGGKVTKPTRSVVEYGGHEQILRFIASKYLNTNKIVVTADMIGTSK